MSMPEEKTGGPPPDGPAGPGGEGGPPGGPGLPPPPQSGAPPPAAAGAPNPQEQAAANKRLQQTQAQVNEVVDIMRVNVEKVLDRDAKLSELDERADNLQHGASQFEANAGKLKRKFWWKNCKSMIMMGVVIGLVVIVACVWIANKMGYLGGSKSEQPVGPPQYYQPPPPPPPAADTGSAAGGDAAPTGDADGGGGE